MTILELQKIITDGDNEIVDKCLKLLGKESLTKLKYSLAPPSSLMNEILDSNIMRARTVIDFIYEMYIDDTLEEKVSYMKKLEIAKRIMPTFDWKEFDRIFEENTTSFLSTKNSKKVEQPSGGM